MEIVKPSQIRNAIKWAIRVNQGVDDPLESVAIMIHGSPGIGKSGIVAQVAREMKYQLRDVRLTLLDPVDLRGLPCVDHGITKWNPPVFFPHDPESRGILFLDELSTAPPMMQGAAYSIIRDRRSGEYTLPRNWIVVAAGNKITDGAIAYKMGTALGTRMVHYELDVDGDEWRDWAIRKGVQAEVLAFLRWRPELLMNFNAKEKNFPCPRTWEFVSNVLKYETDPIQRRVSVSGSIGVEAAAEFIGFLNVWNSLPDVDEILKTGKLSVPSPTEPSVVYALMGCLAHESNPGNFANVIGYLSENILKEFQIVCVRDAIRRNRKLEGCKPYVDWALENKDFHL